MPAINLKKFSRSNVNIPDPIPEQSKDVDETKYDADDDNGNDDNDDNNDEDDFADLQNDVFVSEAEIEKQKKELEKEEKVREKEERKYSRLQTANEKRQKQLEKEAEKQNKKSKQESDDELFSERGTELYGRDRLQLIAKIQQYKVLFPDNKQLKALKVKRNPSVEELQQYVAECESIVDTDVIESFITDSLLQTLKMAEFASVRTKYNIKGLSDMLKENPQFNSLCKQLYIKYKVFSKVPIEAQMLMLVTTSAYVCLEKNRQLESREKLLGQTVDSNLFKV